VSDTPLSFFKETGISSASSNFMYFGCSYQNLEIEEKMEKKQKLDKQILCLNVKTIFTITF
jgi:hypothetical protein